MANVSGSLPQKLRPLDDGLGEAFGEAVWGASVVGFAGELGFPALSGFPAWSGLGGCSGFGGCSDLGEWGPGGYGFGECGLDELGGLEARSCFLGRSSRTSPNRGLVGLGE